MRLGLLWALGALSGLVGALVLYDAQPGINWTIWTLVTTAGLIAYRKPDAQTLRALALPLGFVVVIAIGAAVTTVPILLVAIAGSVASLLALSILIAADSPDGSDYGAVAIITAPFRGLLQTVRGAVEAANATIESTGDPRKRPAVRGAILAAPVVVILALLFATADPLLARGREAIYDAIFRVDAVPRAIFGILVAIFVIGAYFTSQLVLPRKVVPSPVASVPPRTVGLTERRIVLAAAAFMSWIFVLLQISYLFGTVPSSIGSGVTFAEYAHRGFGELTVAATGVALLIVAAHQRLAIDDEPRAHRALMWPSLALIAAVCCILVSAFHRVSLYEDAYGFTSQRVYAQAYMILALAVILVLASHVLREFDVRSLARSVMAVALATLVVMIFWNTDAWVARADLDRYARTGKVDLPYLAHDLSSDAYPTLVRSLNRLDAKDQEQFVALLSKEYTHRDELRESAAWYDWNFRRSRARGVRPLLPEVQQQTAPNAGISVTQKPVASR